MESKLCTIVVNSCDGYQDAWYPFFELTKKFWSDCQFKFILNTETIEYKHEGINLETINFQYELNEHKKLWGKRIKECLKKIDTTFVVLFLEDFFLQKDVNQFELNSCIQMMNDDPNIIAIYFKQIYGYKDSYDCNDKYFLMKENKKYKLNLQAGLWRRLELISLIDDMDSPWSFEDEGYYRIQNLNWIFLCSKNGSHSNIENCVFPYLTDRKSGYGIWSGKWLWKNKKLFKRNNIHVNKIKMKKFTRFSMFLYYYKRLIFKIKASINN